MPLKSNESRVTRRGPDGVLYQWSNSQDKPDGIGWLQASKATFPRVRTYLWFRPAANIQADANNAIQAKQTAEDPSSLQRLSGLIFRPWEFAKQKYNEMITKKETPQFQANQRVKFSGQAYYTTGGVNQLDATIKIKNPVTGEIKTVNAKELLPVERDATKYAVGDKVVLAKGVIDKKEQEVMILGYDALKGTYKVSLSALIPGQKDIKDVITVYPEAIDAFVPNKKANNPNLQITPETLSDADDKAIIEALSRAQRSGRTSVQVKEISNDLKAHGHPVTENQMIYTLSTLNRLDQNIQYNSNSGGVYLGAAKPTLDLLMRTRDISIEPGPFGLTNITQDSNTDAYAHPGIRVKTAETEGIIDGILGDIATIITKEKKRLQVKLDDLKDEYNRNLHIDPAAPKTVGNVRNRDIFWILRDREGVKSIKEGDTVALLPGISNLQINKNQPLSGKVVAVNTDGTIDMVTKVGDKDTQFRAFHRQLALTPQLKSMQELTDYLRYHAKAVRGGAVKVNDTEVLFGGGNNQSITLNFANGEDYAKNEHLWFAPIEAKANPNGWESVINSLGSFWSTPGDYSTTLAPSKALLNYIQEVYPGARFITIARDTTTTPDRINDVKAKIKFSVVINKTAIGKRYDLDRLYEYYGTRSEKASIPASNIGPDNTVRMETDGDSLFIYMGKLFANHRADHLPPVEPYESEVEAMTKKQRAEYELVKGKHPLFKDVIESSMFNRKRAWDADKALEGLAEASSNFTYDETNDRYVVDMGHYNDAHEFLKKFFGEAVYGSNVYETEDKGYYSRAADRLLASKAASHEKTIREQQAARKDTGPIDIKGFYQNSKGFVLRPYQNAAVKFMLKNNATLLAMDQGTGKSASAIAAAVEKLNRLNEEDPTRKHRVLIVAPASVAQTTWLKDLDRAIVPRDNSNNVLPGKYNYTLLMGPGRLEGYKRLADNNDNTSIAVTSYNTFAMQDWLEMKDLGFDVAVLDEAQAINGSEQAGVITQHLQTMMNEIRHKMALTGTPLENDPEDLQGILAWLKPELFGDAKQFMNDFVDIDYLATPDAAGKKAPRKVGVRLKNLGALRSKLAQMMFRVEKSDLTDYNEPAKGETGIHVINFGEAPNERAAFDKYVARYKSPETDEVTKARLGELSVVPNRRVFPQFNKDKPFIRDAATKQLRLNFDPSYNPITTEAYPEYDALVKKAKLYMRAEYMRKIEAGEHPSVQGFMTQMQQVLNDPTLLAKRYGGPFMDEVPNPKIDRLNDIIFHHFGGNTFKQHKGGKVIIFAEHVETLKLLEKRLTKQFPQLAGRFLKFVGQGRTDVTNTAELKTRQHVQDAFNKDPDFQYPIMLATNAAKTGVNLPAANMVINYDVGWNPQDINQRIDRAHRIRSLKDIVDSNTAPARDVTAHSLIVTDPTGDINYSIEARKMFSHKVKERIFDTFIRDKEETDNRDVVIPDEDHQKVMEELLNVTNPAGDRRVDPERAGRHVQQRHDRQTRQELIRKYGHWAKYLPEYPRESQRHTTD